MRLLYTLTRGSRIIRILYYWSRCALLRWELHVLARAVEWWLARGLNLHSICFVVI